MYLIFLWFICANVKHLVMKLPVNYTSAKQLWSGYYLRQGGGGGKGFEKKGSKEFKFKQMEGGGQNFSAYT